MSEYQFPLTTAHPSGCSSKATSEPGQPQAHGAHTSTCVMLVGRVEVIMDQTLGLN